jgi:signal transduction histidine kinase/DNA-binding response OmpR family regulator
MFFLVLIAITPALVIQAYNEYDLRASRENDIRQQTIQITKQFGAEMGELREGAHQLLVALSRIPSISGMDAEKCPQALSALDKSFPNYNFLAVADTQGQIRCTSRPSALSSVADLEFFKRAINHDGLAVGNYWTDPTTGEQAVHFGLRFSKAGGGPIAGVVFASLDLKWLAEHLKERGLTSTQSILIADREGNIIARLPNGEKLVGKNMRKGHAEIMDGDTAGWEEAKGVDGVERIFGYVPPALPPGDFFLSAGESKAAAFATISGITQRGIVLILLGFVIAAFAAWMGGRRFIQRPIANLLQVSGEWRTGDYSARAQVKDRQSEIGQLGLAFNQMADSVQARHAAQGTAEEQLRELNATLEQRVEERTQELVSANLAKSQFLANMSHEIRTPMNGVLGMIELLLQTELAPTQQRYVETVRRSADTLLGLINGILDLSKIEAGKLELECHDFNLRELMEDITYSFSEAAGRKGLELMCFVSSNVPTELVGDPGRLRQIFTNLIGNAMKFTAAGEIVLDASLTEATATSALLQFEVRDTGVGISPENQARIFSAFSQADGSMSRRYGGTGLGLSIAKDLCEMMGGSIEVTSEQGVGSIFRFTARFGQQATSVRHSSASRYANRLRVLVVDDNPTNREILQDQLTHAGFRVAVAESGAEGLTMARNAASHGYPFGVALVDMMMPDLNGLELAQAIKSDPVLAALRVVLLTSLGQEMSENSPHVVAQLTKPVRGRELLDCLYALENDDVPSPAASKMVWPASSLAPGLRVLLVEDSPVNTEVALGILESFRCTVETAVHGREALAIYAERNFDVIFMDCQMPEMDGFETTAEIRKREAAGGRRTPIIALTANAIKGDRELCLQADMDNYLAKPFTRSQMEEVLKALFAGPNFSDTVAQEHPLSASAFLETAPTDVLDERVFAALRQLQRSDRPDIVKRTIGLYFETAPRLLQELREGAVSRDVAVLGRASHSLKSNSANVGAIKLAARCSELEALARCGKVADACALVRGVIEDYILADAVLSEHLGKAA